MLAEDEEISRSLRQIVCGLTSDRTLQQDLLQECLVCLWRVEGDKPGRTRSWYLQNCRFHVQHWLAGGRSVDSTKRARGDKRMSLHESDAHAVLPNYHTDGELLAAVSAQDIVATLARYLKPCEQLVLLGLSEGLAVGEISSAFRISRPTVIKYRRKIAALAIKLGISDPFASLEGNGHPLRGNGSESQHRTEL